MDEPGAHAISIAAMAAQARDDGRPKKGLLVPVGDGPAFQAIAFQAIAYEVDADGTVSVLTEGWEAVVEDGKIIAFRGPRAVSGMR